MDALQQWEQVMFTSFREFSHTIVNALPNVIGALLLLLVGWLIARLVAYAIRKVLQSRTLSRLTDRLNKLAILQNAHVSVNSVQIISQFVYWVILLLFFIAASETLGWTAVSRSIGNLINYLPALLSAIVIALVGLYIAQVVRNVIRATLHSLRVGAANAISTFAFYVIAAIVILTALDQAGVDTTVITNNLTLIIGAVVGAFAIAFALASRSILENILASFYSRKSFAVGDNIKIKDIEGQIVRIDSVSVTVKTTQSEVVMPVRTLISERVEKK